MNSLCRKLEKAGYTSSGFFRSIDKDKALAFAKERRETGEFAQLALVSSRGRLRGSRNRILRNYGYRVYTKSRG